MLSKIVIVGGKLYWLSEKTERWYQILFSSESYRLKNTSESELFSPENFAIDLFVSTRLELHKARNSGSAIHRKVWQPWSTARVHKFNRNRFWILSFPRMQGFPRGPREFSSCVTSSLVLASSSKYDQRWMSEFLNILVNFFHRYFRNNP